MGELFASFLALFSLLFGGAETLETGRDTDFKTYPDVVEARVLHVIDGDTIDVEIGGNTERVRYIGIDTPEPYENAVPECFSKEATDANRKLVEGNTVRLVTDKERRDDYGRILRYVYVGDTFVNEALLRNGHARLLFIPPNTRAYDSFKEIEQEARTRGVGLWEACS